MCVFSAYHKDEQDSRIFGCDEVYRNVLCVCFQRIIKMNKILGYLDVMRIIVMWCVCFQCIIKMNKIVGYLM